MSRFPWWGSVVLAIGCYWGLKYGVASVLPADHRLVGLLGHLAPIAAMALLLLAGKQLYDHDDHPQDPAADQEETEQEEESAER